MHHADVGGDTADHELLRRQLYQPVGQVGVEEAAVPLLGNQVAAGDMAGQLGDDIGLLGADYAMDGEDLELQVVGVVVVGQEQDLRPCGFLPLNQL